MKLPFSDNLKAAREAKGLTQAELAEMVGVSQPAIAQYELGTRFPLIIIAVNIEEVLGVTCKELVKGLPED